MEMVSGALPTDKDNNLKYAIIRFNRYRNLGKE
jgi:hypothetical protein